jgi:hypothetical protein
MHLKLIDRLAQAQEALKRGEINVPRLEELRADVEHAFNQSMSSLLERLDFLEAYEKRRRERIAAVSPGTTLPKLLRFAVSAPFIYGAFVPMVIFHIGIELYQQICFRLYRIPLVRPAKYFIYDRSLLPRLGALDRFNCYYCSYFNNLMAYASEIGARTERYWCPIKYARRLTRTHTQYNRFIGPEDGKAVLAKWEELRDFSDMLEKEKS